jgi:hypothetical protein
MAAPAIVFHSRIPQAKAETHQAIFQAVQETFELDIHPAAVERSPVTPEGLARNLALQAAGKLGGRPPAGTGRNRQMLATETVQTENGPKATLYSQSGYGGYLEVGTTQMRAQPYMYSSFIEHVDKIPARVNEKIASQGFGPKSTAGND